MAFSVQKSWKIPWFSTRNERFNVSKSGRHCHKRAISIIWNLIVLQELHLGSSPFLFHLPSSIYNLQHLRRLCLYGNVQFLEDKEIGRQALSNSYGGYSKYGLPRIFWSCRLEKCLSLGSEDFNHPNSIIRFNRLCWLVIEDSKFLHEIPKLLESIRRVDATNCISLNTQSLSKLFLQVPLSLSKL